MRLIHKTSAISFRLFHTGFQTFKDRIREELSTVSRFTLDSVIDDASLYSYYRSGNKLRFRRRIRRRRVIKEKTSANKFASRIRRRMR